MRKIFKLCFVLLLLSVSPAAFAQDVIVQIAYDSVFNGTGSSSGSKNLQMRGYSMQAVVARIFGVEKSLIRIDETLAKKTVSVKIETKGNIWQTDLKPAFTQALKDKFGITINIKAEQAPVWVAYLPNEESINKTKCLTDGNGVSKNFSKTPEKWTATCANTQDLLSTISEWSGKIIVNETMTRNLYNFEVKLKTWQDLINDLDLNYGIVLTEETRSIEFINLGK